VGNDAELEIQQDRISQCLNNGGMSFVQQIATTQVATSYEKPHLRWKVIISEQFPLLADVARRVLIMGTQYADAERVYKAHKEIQTKVRNRLKTRQSTSYSTITSIPDCSGRSTKTTR
jgi:hypothetical protein